MIKSTLGVFAVAIAVVWSASMLTAQSMDSQQAVQLIPAPRDLPHEDGEKCVPRTLPPGLNSKLDSRPFELPAPIGTRPQPATLYSRKPPFAPVSPHLHPVIPLLPRAPAILPQIVEIDPKPEQPREATQAPGIASPEVLLPDQSGVQKQLPVIPPGTWSPEPNEAADTIVNSQGVRTRIDRLRMLLEARKRELAAQEAAEKPEEIPAVEPAPEEKPELPVEPPAESAQIAEKSTEPIEATPVSTEPKLLMTSPVNRLRLADNLFGAGDTKTALQAYSAIKLNEISEIDQAWVQFQMASCHRRLGDIPKAEKHYRIVASYQSAGTIADAARWWLDRLEAKKELTLALSRLTTIVDTLQKVETP